MEWRQLKTWIVLYTCTDPPNANFPAGCWAELTRKAVGQLFITGYCMRQPVTRARCINRIYGLSGSISPQKPTQCFGHSLCNFFFFTKAEAILQTKVKDAPSHTLVFYFMTESLKKRQHLHNQQVLPKSQVFALATDGTANDREPEPHWGIPPPTTLILNRHLWNFSNEKAQHRSYFADKIWYSYIQPAKQNFIFPFSAKDVNCLVFILHF